MLPGKIVRNFAASHYLRASNTILSFQASSINGKKLHTLFLFKIHEPLLLLPHPQYNSSSLRYFLFTEQSMAINGRTSSQTHVVVNCDLETFLRHILPFFGIISLVTSSSVRIYRSYSNDEIPTLSFVIFLCFAASMLCYCLELNQRIPPWKKSPKKHKLLIGIWLLMNALMVGFCFKFAKLTRSSASMSFFGVVTGGNMLVLHLYSIWGEYNLRNCSVKFSRTISVRVNERTDEMEMRGSEFV